MPQHEILSVPPHARTTTGDVALLGDLLFWLWRADHESLVCDLESSTWTPMTCRPVAYTREDAVLAPAGDALLVWGGGERTHTYSRSRTAKRDGVRIARDGSTRPMSLRGAPSARTTRMFAWTGEELLVWGGLGKRPLGDGAAYDPATDTWRKLSTEGAPTPRYGCENVFTGRELLVWGGADFTRSMSSGGFLADGAAYDPVADTWRPIAPIPNTAGGLGASRSTLWVGDEALFVRRDYVVGADIDTVSVWRYDVAKDSFTPACAPPELGGRASPQLFAIGRRAFMLLGEVLLEYLPARDAWVRHDDLVGYFEPKIVSHDRFAIIADVGRARFSRFTPPTELPEPLPARKSRAGRSAETVHADASADEDVGLPVLRTKLASLPRGPAVTAVAIDARRVAVGNLRGEVVLGSRSSDGVTRGLAAETPSIVRAVDDVRVEGLALVEDGVLVLTARALELRTFTGEVAKRLALDAPAHALVCAGGRCFVAARREVIAIDLGSEGFVSGPRTTVGGAGGAIRALATSIDGAQLVVTVQGPRARTKREQRDDFIYVLDARTLAQLAYQPSAAEPGTTAAVLVPGRPTRKTKTSGPDVLVAGAGRYGIERIPVGKQRKTEALRTDSAWNEPIALDGTGTRLLSVNARCGVEVLDVETGRAVMALALFDYDDYRPLEALCPLPSFLEPEEAARYVAVARYAGPLTAVALAPEGDAGVGGSASGAAFVFDVARGSVDALSGTTITPWQPGASEVVWSDQALAIGANVEQGALELVLADGTYAELDVQTGALNRGPRIDVAKLEPLRSEVDPKLSLRRHGAFLLVGGRTAEVFSLDTGEPVPERARLSHPEGKGVWTVQSGAEGHALVKLDALSLAFVKKVPLPGAPGTSTLRWLGRERFLVHLVDDPNAMIPALSARYFVVDAATGKVEALEADGASETLDGETFAVPIGRGRAWRRWQIVRDDVGSPVRSLVSGNRFTHVGALPDGEHVLGWAGRAIGWWDARGALHGPYTVHGAHIEGACPARSGRAFVTWDARGYVRRWVIP